MIVLSKGAFKFLLTWTISLLSETVVSEAYLQPCMDCDFEDREHAARVMATIPDLFHILAERFGGFHAVKIIFSRLKT